MFAKHIVDAFRSWRRRSQIRYELYNLSDRQLADIGLARSDIEAVASGSFERTAAR